MIRQLIIQTFYSICHTQVLFFSNLNQDIDRYFEAHEIQLPTLNRDYDAHTDPGRKYSDIK